MVSQDYQKQMFSSNNNDYLTENALKMRLDVSPLLNTVESFLKGIVLTANRDSQTRNVTYETSQVGEPLLNDKGVQHTLNTLNMLLGAHTVLGNLNDKEIEDFIYELDTALSTAFIINMADWGLKIQHYDLILTNIVLSCIAFFSRTKNGFESNNLQTRVHSVSSESLQQKSGGLFQK